MTDFSAGLVTLHSREGLPIETSLDMAVERRVPVSLLGLLLGAAAEKMPRSFVVEMAGLWAARFAPTPAERLAMAALSEKP